jgi:hypothetical protein
VKGRSHREASPWVLAKGRAKYTNSVEARIEVWDEDYIRAYGVAMTTVPLSKQAPVGKLAGNVARSTASVRLARNDVCEGEYSDRRLDFQVVVPWRRVGERPVSRENGYVEPADGEAFTHPAQVWTTMTSHIGLKNYDMSFLGHLVSGIALSIAVQQHRTSYKTRSQRRSGVELSPRYFAAERALGSHSQQCPAGTRPKQGTKDDDRD